MYYIYNTILLNVRQVVVQKFLEPDAEGSDYTNQIPTVGMVVF